MTVGRYTHKAALALTGPAHLQVWAVPEGGRVRCAHREPADRWSAPGDVAVTSTAYRAQEWALILPNPEDPAEALRVGWCYLLPDDEGERALAQLEAEAHAAVVLLCAWLTGDPWRLWRWGSTAWVGIEVHREVARDALADFAAAQLELERRG